MGRKGSNLTVDRRVVLQSAGGLTLASTVLTGPAVADSITAPRPSHEFRQSMKLAFDWKFALGHASDMAKDFGFGRDQRTYAKTGGSESSPIATAALPGFDDSSWSSVQIPHDWAIDLPFDPGPGGFGPDQDDPHAAHGYRALGRDHPENSVGWYRRPLDIPADWSGRRLSLEFDGAFRQVVVFLNGIIVDEHAGGYVPFTVDITDVAHPGETNWLVVRVDASLGEGWFYEGAGLYRHVHLTATDPIHLPPHGVFIQSAPRGAGATAKISIDVRNQSDAAPEARVRTIVLAPNGLEMARNETGLSITAWGDGKVEHDLAWDAAPLWSPSDPQLHRLVVEVEVGGRITDRTETSFGVRSAVFDAKRGFLLNGQPLKLLGACCHQDHAGVGAAIPDRLQDWRIEQLKAMGCNAYRASHNPATPELMDACDRLGMLVIAETRRMSSDDESMAELATLVRRDRNRPSVIAWSIGNEEQAIQGNETGAAIARTMKRLVNRLDPSRPVTAAKDQDFDTGVSRVVDVLGFNYRTPQMEGYHARFPDQPILGSETGSTVSTRGEYVLDAARHIVPAYDREHPWWASTAEEWWTIAAERPYIAGGFIWTGFDYRGEPTPYSRWPSVGSYFGAMDSCGFPKDNYWYYRAWWRPEPLLHLFPHWNWEGREGEEIEVWVHSNLDRVELLVNGRSAGAKMVERNRHLAWSVPYAPGVLEARGYKNGRLVATQRRETAGAPAALRLSVDRQRLTADGEDVAMIAASVVDARGRPCPRANDLVVFEVAGDARVIGVGNGDPVSHEPDRSDRRHLFNGLAQAIVQTGRKGGPITVTARAEGLRPAVLRLDARTTKQST
ncbi:beta-galactosidase [Brevundimonas intermedia]|uniref:Beta-galactosidase n=1 Tax=Brevundimonas intermedia TaxID=74315 RepID=A0ABQ5TC51_9CAUL|nr:beta-galactosidase GalA [Brevundimonas intermedia]GLK49722.1 beta-galactosidase [Brevundimonas intermedia]